MYKCSVLMKLLLGVIPLHYIFYIKALLYLQTPICLLCDIFSRHFSTLVYYYWIIFSSKNHHLWHHPFEVINVFLKKRKALLLRGRSPWTAERAKNALSSGWTTKVKCFFLSGGGGQSKEQRLSIFISKSSTS